MKILGLDRRCPCRESNWRPSEYKHRVVLLDQLDRTTYVVKHAEYVKLVVLSMSLGMFNSKATNTNLLS